MSPSTLRELLDRVAHGQTSPDAALEQLRDLPYADLGFATVDHHRALRQGFPEVVFGAGKTPEQIAAILGELAERQVGAPLLATRATPEAFEAARARVTGLEYDEVARLIFRRGRTRELGGPVAVVSAGTSDEPVAREAALCLELMGASLVRVSDVGVAGLHRLLARLDEIRACRAAIVVAGMEGALPSVLGGLLEIPVVAVPTSVGYGAAFGGLAALLGMLNTCASGVAVVNIDNGFGAAAFAASILRQSSAREFDS